MITTTIFVYYAVDDKLHLVLQYNKFTCIINVVTSVIKTSMDKGD